MESHGPPSPDGKSSRGVLLAVSEEHLDDEVIEELKQHAGEGREVYLVAPAIADTRLQHVMGGVDEGIEEADALRDHVGERLEEAGFELKVSRVGDADPVEAISDTLLEHPDDIDEIVMVTPTHDEMRPLEKSEFERARDRFDLPITHIEAGSSGIAEEEHAEPGEHGTAGDIESKESANLPPLSRYDVLAMVVGIVGTLILIVIAASCAADADRSAGCEFTMLLAGAFFLINVAHVFALTLFQTERYRGVFDKFFASVSLYGTTAAVIVGLIIS